MKTRLLLLFFAPLLFLTQARAGDTLRVMTYNALDFRGSQDADRVDDFRRVIAYVSPDVVAMEEIVSEAAVDYLLSFAYLPDNDDWAVAPFTNGNGSDTDNALFYRTSKVQLAAQSSFDTDPRDVDVYTLQAVSPDTSLRLSVYACHLKAGNTPNDASRRADAAQDIRQHLDQLSDGELFVLVGDFNLYTSAESAYQILLSAANPSGQLFDPIDEPGSWNNNPAFALIHTQCPRAELGGMDDRFDFVLASGGLIDTSGTCVLPATYHAVGNDGQHLNQSINDGINSAVPDSIADALYYASDHLPVATDVLLRVATAGAAEPPVAHSFQLLTCYPNPFNSILTIELAPSRAASTLSVHDVLGRRVAEQGMDASPVSQTVRMSFAPQSSGVYYVRVQTPSSSESQKVTLIR